MNYNECVNEIVSKCNGRLNILKILSNKSWSLSSDILKCIYFSLIRSIIEYNSMIFPLISERIKRLRAIQYNALKISYRKPLKTTNTELLTLSKTTILNERYFENCIKFNNKLVQEIVKNYLNWYTINRNSNYKTILCNYRENIENLK